MGQEVKVECPSLEQQIVELRGRLQELSAEVEKLRILLDQVVAAADSNASAFRDSIQILDAKSCIQEVVLSDMARELAGQMSGPGRYLKITPDGQLNTEFYFDEWRKKLVQEEAISADPYEGAVIFGGDYAKVDEPSGDNDA